MNSGLELHIRERKLKSNERLMTWSGDPDTNLSVRRLPSFTLEPKAPKPDFGGEDVQVTDCDSAGDTVKRGHTAVEVITFEKDEGQAPPSQLYPFYIRWGVSGKRKAHVIACEDEAR